MAGRWCYGTASRYSTSGTCLRSSSSRPRIRLMTVLGQPAHAPPSRNCTTPSATPTTSINVPPSSSDGPPASPSMRSSREFRSVGGMMAPRAVVFASPLTAGGEEVARRLDVLTHLLHQRRDVGERPRRPQPLHEIDRQRAAVQVAGEAD